MWQDGPPPPVTCAVCGKQFTVSPMARRPKYCGRACQTAASTARRTERRRIRREQLAVTPQVPDVPVMPWRIAESALCADPATTRRIGYPWTSDIPARRALARAVCKSCPVSPQCLEWSITAIPATDTTVYGGAGHFTCNRIRRSRCRPAGIPAQPAATRETGAA